MLTYLINSTLEMRFDSGLSFIHSLKTISYRIQVHNVPKRMCIIKSATQIKRQRSTVAYRYLHFKLSACTRSINGLYFVIIAESNKHHGRSVEISCLIGAKGQSTLSSWCEIMCRSAVAVTMQARRNSDWYWQFVSHNGPCRSHCRLYLAPWQLLFAFNLNGDHVNG